MGDAALLLRVQSTLGSAPLQHRAYGQAINFIGHEGLLAPVKSSEDSRTGNHTQPATSRFNDRVPFGEESPSEREVMDRPPLYLEHKGRAPDNWCESTAP
jgi:hypothetical protein